MAATDSEATYKVVINDEEQYSILAAETDTPRGWRDEGMRGRRGACLEYIAGVWTDMRPLSLRLLLDRQEAPGQAGEEAPADDPGRRLSAAMQPAVLIGRGTLREDLDQGLVHLRFPETGEGTELSVCLDRAACDSSRADLDAEAGMLRIRGAAILNGETCLCTAEIDLATRSGTAVLERAG